MKAIKVICRMRHDENRNYTFKEIAHQIYQDFNIQVSRQTISALYFKYKDHVDIQPEISTSVLNERQSTAELDISHYLNSMKQGNRHA